MFASLVVTSLPLDDSRLRDKHCRVAARPFLRVYGSGDVPDMTIRNLAVRPSRICQYLLSGRSATLYNRGRCSVVLHNGRSNALRKDDPPRNRPVGCIIPYRHYFSFQSEIILLYGG